MAVTINTKHTTAGERRVVTKAIDDALAAGLRVTVNDGEENVVKQSADKGVILAAMASTGQDYIYFYQQDGLLGWMSLIWGNCPTGCEVIADYSANGATEALLKGANDLAQSLDK